MSNLIQSLSPEEMARQLGRPEGEAGLAVAQRINTVNARVTDDTLRRLGLRAGNRVLEIGFGNGHLTPGLMALAPDLHYAGIDISETMVAEATAFNHTLVATGRARFEKVDVAKMPFADAAFDRAFAVNAIYFWPDQLAALREICRVMAPGGRCVIASATPDTAAATNFMTEANGFRIPDRERLEALHREAGFGWVEIETYDEVVTRPNGEPWQRIYFMVAASR